MTKSGYQAPPPRDFPPIKVSPPDSFEGIELYPAGSFKGTRTRVGKLGDLIKQEDDLGPCLVAHFKVADTLVVFYQSACDAEDHWTVFADMLGCVAQAQPPSHISAAVVSKLSSGKILCDWINTEADTEYRSRRRKKLHANSPVRFSRSKISPSPERGWERFESGAANDSGRMVASAKSGRYKDTKSSPAPSAMPKVRVATSAKKAVPTKSSQQSASSKKPRPSRASRDQ